MNGLTLIVIMEHINSTLAKQYLDIVMDKLRVNLVTDIVDLGDGNGNLLQQHQPLEFVDIMEQEVFPMEFQAFAGWISDCYFADMKKGKLTVGLKFH